MLRASSTWRSSALATGLAGLIVGLVACAPPCWPPVIEGGQRLQHVAPMPVNWIPLLLRQHEVCWRPPAAEREKRAFLTGSSGVFGFPHPAEDAVPGVLNSRRSFEGRVHFFNLGHVYSYQLKDALILREALRYEPDLIVHAIDLSDMTHSAPFPVLDLNDFIDGNRGPFSAFAAEEPAGLTEPLLRLRAYYDDHEELGPLDDWRQVGRFARMTARTSAYWFRDLPGVRPEAVTPWVPTPNELPVDDPRYDCKQTVENYRRVFGNWQSWSILEYLDQVRAETGIPVVIVHWPIAHRPRGRCYSVRFPKAELAEFREWIEAETRRLDLPYLDYSDLLPPSDFVDSIHPTREGQRRIAVQLARDLEPWL